MDKQADKYCRHYLHLLWVRGIGFAFVLLLWSSLSSISASTSPLCLVEHSCNCTCIQILPVSINEKNLSTYKLIVWVPAIGRQWLHKCADQLPATMEDSPFGPWLTLSDLLSDVGCDDTLGPVIRVRWCGAHKCGQWVEGDPHHYLHYRFQYY